jgi:hypothetical protein
MAPVFSCHGVRSRCDPTYWISHCKLCSIFCVSKSTCLFSSYTATVTLCSSWLIITAKLVQDISYACFPASSTDTLAPVAYCFAPETSRQPPYWFLPFCISIFCLIDFSHTHVFAYFPAPKTSRQPLNSKFNITRSYQILHYQLFLLFRRIAVFNPCF